MKRVLFYLFFLSLVLSPGGTGWGGERWGEGGGRIKTRVRVQKDVRYGPERDQTLDVYLPPEGKEVKTTAVVFVHGGAFIGGDKKSGTRYCTLLASHGFPCVSINYRLAPSVSYQGIEWDARNAVKWVRARLKEKSGAEVKKVVVMGTSAGGHISALLGTKPEKRAEKRGCDGEKTSSFADLFPGVSSRPDGVADLWGSSYIVRSHSTLATKVNTALQGKCGEKWDLEKFAPLNFVDSSDPPFLIVHGEKDTVVSVDHSYKLRDALQEVGVPVKMVVVKNAGHGLKPAQKGKPLEPSKRKIAEEILQFVEKIHRWDGKSQFSF